MTTRTVTTQAELNAAISEHVDTIYIDSPRGVWLRVTNSGNSSVVARENSSVVARENSSVVARDNSSVVARENSSVVAWRNSSVVARENSSVVARENSSVVAWENSSVVAARFTAVFVHSQRVTLDAKGAVIDMTEVDLTDRATWLDYTGATPDDDGKLLVYKAVDSDLNAGHSYTLTRYEPGTTVTAPDWRPDNSCGHGLHFGLTPMHARVCFNGRGKPRFMACSVDAATFMPIGDKLKAPSCVVLYEVDVRGQRIETAEVAS